MANQSTRPSPALIPRYSITGECTSPCYWWLHFKIQNKQYNATFQICRAYSVQNILWTQHMKLRKQEGNTTPSVLILFSIQACFSAQVLQKSRIQQDERKLKTTQVTGGQGTVQKIELLPHVWYITSLQGQKELVGGWNVWHFFFFFPSIPHVNLQYTMKISPWGLHCCELRASQAVPVPAQSLQAVKQNLSVPEEKTTTGKTKSMLTGTNVSRQAISVGKLVMSLLISILMREHKSF